ncbi:DUF222 domain-containing protein [Nocardioides immobilis]|uniref:DUF222 domain-containing protein n=1 Tax=Nocardioides immobilis TaxID=2049295 RepID=A0A417XZ47_9ACTN|nr:DUF222 domain-containing protein [Nocardioides immobilis]RHW25634.1 DUF222 domain-containing protein [Nocardioides immobilis]
MSDQPQDLHPIVGAVTAARESLKGVRDVQPVFMSPAAQTDAVTSIAALEGMLAELKLRVLAASGDAADQAGARDVGAWLAHLTQADSSMARAEAHLATALDRKWSRVAAGMAEGTVSAEQARAIVAGLDNLPDRVGTEVLAKAEEQLVDYARDYRPSELRRLARHILDVVAPEIAEAEAAKRLEAEEQRAREKTRLSLRPVGDGTTRLSGMIPDEAAARLRAYLEAFTSPRKAKDAPTGEEDRIPTPVGSAGRSAR